MVKRLLTSLVLVMSLLVSAEEGFDDDGFDDEIIEIIVDNTPTAKGA